ncbi:ThuA domain-containing protein [Roseibacillus ishigakijimensis]|uniref:ThuA domain-containing protein n=1 Tax=Roseibacillus ishigakijimensis TaxID=454146 RepID=A0A934RRV4_9BACT|nr:ThuA domain-containing protein [Roseibacillus ishigakijimensis]MBK1834777.1 ThuA domain-containing protein [Roseibacillus ishigakijimensis]
MSDPLLGHGFRVLVFTKTAGYTHQSIAAGRTAIAELGVNHDFEVTHTDQAETFISLLSNHQVVVFLNTTGDVLSNSQQEIFQNWYRQGGGFVGIHAATDTEHSWPWYLEMVGAQFSHHGPIQSGTVKFLDTVHPITQSGPEPLGEWTVNEEWYNFVTSPRGKVHVLAVVEEEVTTSNPFGEAPRPGISDGAHGDDHPIMWCREFEGGRSVYLGPGHQAATFSDPLFRDILSNSIEWAGRELNGDSGATINENWEKIVLEQNLSNPMSLALAPTGDIYLLERFGALKKHDQGSGLTSTIGQLDVYSGGEYGGLGLALAPDFDQSRHLYLLWSPAQGPATRISRFTLDRAGQLDPGSEVVILEYLTNRVNSGHHQAGCLRFGPEGALYASVGDNTQASGYSPRNENEIGRDGRKGAPNSNDLRGKIIRILPAVDAGPPEHPHYLIPEGNLFPPGTGQGRPEIYVMGCRNPFRFSIDAETGWLYFGDVGPDATNSGNGAFQGTGGHDEFNQVKAPGWFGWPYYLADNKPYLDGQGQPWTLPSLRADLSAYFQSANFLSSGALAGDPALIPEPQPAWIWYPDQEAAPAFAELGSNSGRCALAGAVYRYQPGGKTPAYYDGSVFLLLWSRNKILEAKTRPDGSLLELTEFAPHLSFQRPHEMVFGPEGAIYLIEWGNGNLVKLNYTRAKATPIVQAAADVTSGATPLTVQFSSAGTYDPDSAALTYAWDFDGDQITDATEPNPRHRYEEPGLYQAQLTVSDDEGLFARASLTISVGNFAPQISFQEPAGARFFDWGDEVDYSLQVSDHEDGSTAAGTIAAEEVLFEASLGHADHQHNEVQSHLLTGRLLIPRDESHPFDLDLSYVLEGFYTDRGAPGVGSVSSQTRLALQPKITMAQTFDGQSGVSREPTLDVVGGDEDVTAISNGDSFFFRELSLAGIDAIRLRASSLPGGTVEIRQESVHGPLLGTLTITPTSEEADFEDFTTSLSQPLEGPRDLHFVFRGSPEEEELMRVNWIGFRGPGASAVRQGPEVTALEALGPDRLRVRFDQEMDEDSLAEPGHYTLDREATVTQVRPHPDQRAVDLTLSGVSAGQYYTLTLGALEDLAGDPLAQPAALTFLHRSAAETSFWTGLNAGGPDYTDREGHLYLADSGTPPDTTAHGTVLVDFFRLQGASEDPVRAAAADFAEADPAVALSAPVNEITSNPSGGVALAATGLSGLTFSNESAGIHTTNKGLLDDLPIFDGYLHTGSSSAGRTATLAGLEGIATGSPITLTLWGVGDTPESEAFFTVRHGGEEVGHLDLDYDTATAEDPSPARGQLVFPKVAGASAIDIEWGRGSTDTAGFNGFSLTTPGAILSSGGGSYHNSSRTASTDSEIANTDDEALYQTERWFDGDLRYEIPVPPGSYQVLLRFAENYFGSTGTRTFNVSLEGGTELFSPDLDLVAQTGGQNRAWDHLSDPVEVTDGRLTIDFWQRIENPKVSAIGVFQVSEDLTPLPQPSFAHHLSQQPGAGWRAERDSDGDGLSSLMEYALGGREGEDDRIRWPRAERSAGEELALVFSRPKGLPDLHFGIEASHDLRQWTLLDAEWVVREQDEEEETFVYCQLETAATSAGLPPGPARFYRLRVELTDPR